MSLVAVSVAIGGELRASSTQASVLIGEGLQSVVRTLEFDSTSVATETASASANGTRAPFQGSGSASAFPQLLRASASGSLSSTAFDENYDFDEDVGVPPVYIVQASANFSETLSFGGELMRGYKSKYIMRLTGNISGTGAFAVVNVSHAQSDPQSWVIDSPGTFHRIITTESFVTGTFPEFYSMSIIAGFNADTSTLMGSSSSGVAQFSNTLELIGIDLRDAETNQLVPQGSVIGSSGTVYEIIDAGSIPEPTALALCGVPLAIWAWHRSRVRR